MFPNMDKETFKKYQKQGKIMKYPNVEDMKKVNDKKKKRNKKPFDNEFPDDREDCKESMVSADVAGLPSALRNTPLKRKFPNTFLDFNEFVKKYLKKSNKKGMKKVDSEKIEDTEKDK
jgi:hypothetical protein